MKNAAVSAGSEIVVGLSCMSQCALFGESYVEVKLGVVPLETRKIHLCEIHRGDFSKSYKFAKFGDGAKGELIEIAGNAFRPERRSWTERQRFA